MSANSQGRQIPSREGPALRFLIIEDEKRMALLLKKALEEKNHSVIVAFAGDEGLFAAKQGAFDAIVLDLMLPAMNGFEVARELRASENRTPVLVLTARDGVADIVKALDLGVDDYLTKPFALAEFMARLRAVARRGPADHNPQLRVGDLVLDPASGQVSRSNKAVTLTKTEYALLEFLMRRPGRILSRDTIIEGVWGNGSDIEDNTLEALIKRVRAKIDNDYDVKLIQTVRGFGYRMLGNSGS
ncbi:MAG TPA: response regulator transcription factor [Bryobacteraceae bacterium]|jgi:two-component system response regulator MprA